MPQKIRQLKAALAKAGFFFRPGKGSHTVWEHPESTGRYGHVSWKRWKRCATISG